MPNWSLSRLFLGDNAYQKKVIKTVDVHSLMSISCFKYIKHEKRCVISRHKKYTEVNSVNFFRFIFIWFYCTDRTIALTVEGVDKMFVFMLPNNST